METFDEPASRRSPAAKTRIARKKKKNETIFETLIHGITLYNSRMTHFFQLILNLLLGFCPRQIMVDSSTCADAPSSEYREMSEV